MPTFSSDTSSLINTVTVPGVTTATPKRVQKTFKAQGLNDTGLAAAATPLIGTVTQGIKNAYQGLAQSELTGAERAADFVDQDTIDQVFPVSGPSSQDALFAPDEQGTPATITRLVDEELDLTRISALRAQGKISAAHATTLVNAAVKRVSNEFPGLAPQLRRRNAEFFSSISGRSLLENTVAENAALKSTAKVVDQIRSKYVRLGGNPSDPLEVQQKAVQNQNRFETETANLGLLADANIHKARRAISNTLAASAPVVMDSLDRIATSDASAADKAIMWDKTIISFSQQMKETNAKFGGTLTPETMDNYTSELRGYVQTLTDVDSNKISATQAKNKRDMIEAQADIDLYQNVSPTALRVLNIIGSSNALVNSLTNDQRTGMKILLDKVARAVSTPLTGALSGVTSGTGPVEGTGPGFPGTGEATTTETLDEDQVEYAGLIFNGIPVDPTNKEQVDFVKSAQSASLKLLSNTLTSTLKPWEAKTWEGLMESIADPKTAELDLNEGDVAVVTRALQMDYEFKLQNAAVNDLNKVVYITDPESGNLTPTRASEFLTVTNNGVAFNMGYKPGFDPRSLDLASRNALEEARRNLERKYIPRLNRLVRAQSHLEGHTDYGKKVDQIQDVFGNNIKFSPNGQVSPGITRLQLDNDELIIEDFGTSR